MRILGIDPGLQCTGFGVVDTEGADLHYVASGTIQTSPKDGALLPERLKILFDGISEVEARGCCLTALVANGLSVAEYTALQLKKAVVGYGRADKAQMQEMVKRLLKLPGLPGKDAADALGLCITHAQVARSVAAINKVSALQARTHAAYKGGRSY